MAFDVRISGRVPREELPERIRALLWRPWSGEEVWAAATAQTLQEAILVARERWRFITGRSPWPGLHWAIRGRRSDQALGEWEGVLGDPLRPEDATWAIQALLEGPSATVGGGGRE